MSALGNLLTPATRGAMQYLAKSSGPVQVLPKTGINTFFQNLFKTAPKVVIPTVTKTGKGTISSIFSKTNVISGGILGTTLASSLFLSSPQGQNTVNTAGQAVGDITNLGKSVNDLLVKNPLIPIGLLILGGLIVVSVIKK